MSPRRSSRRADSLAPRRTTRESEDALLAELRALYGELDAMYADWSCPTSAECCHFGFTAREPFVTSIELALLKRAVKDAGGPLPALRRSLPIVKEGRADRACPMLTRDGRCQVYDARPLGCRSFYCHRATRGEGPERADLRDVLRRIKDLAARHQERGDEGRPLGRMLGI